MPHKIDESVHVCRTGHGAVFRRSNVVLLFEVTIKRVDRTETDLSGDKQHRFIRFGQQPAGSRQTAVLNNSKLSGKVSTTSPVLQCSRSSVTKQ